MLTQCFHITNTHGRHQHYSYGCATTPTSALTTALKAEVDDTAKKSQYLSATLEKGLKFHRDKKTVVTVFPWSGMFVAVCITIVNRFVVSSVRLKCEN